MSEICSGHNSSRCIFELSIKDLHLTLNHAVDVDLVWIAGNQRSQTGTTISLTPHRRSHKVNQKLLIHYTFYDDSVNTTKSIIQVVESKRYVKPVTLAECELDLTSIINDRIARDMCVPLKTKLDPDASLTFSVMVTNFIFTGNSTIHSTSMSISGDTILGDEESSEGSVVSRGTRTHVLHGMGNSDIYRTINKMATKLSHIENEIKCKTLKLNKINRQNLDEVNGIRSRLEYHISQKDKQIRILTAQLDEMHTALALSHERELRSVNKGPGYGDFSVHYDVDSRKDTNSEMDASMRLYRNQTCISKNSIPLRSNLAFDRRSHTMDKGLGGLKTTNVSTRNTVEARAHGDKIVSGIHNEYYTGFSPELEPSPVPYDIANSNRIMNKTHSNKEPKGIPSNLAHPSKHIVPLAWVKGSISNGGKASLESGANMVRNNRSLQPDSKLTHTLRTPGTTVLPLGTAPTLVHRHCLPVTKNEDMDKTTSQLNNLGQSVKPPAIKTLETQNASKAVSSMVTANEDDTNAKIAILERDLITTKVALADSETQRDIEIAKILKSKAST